MNNLALRKTIVNELDYVKQRLDDYRSIACIDPDNIFAVKMVYFYGGQLDVLTNLSYFFKE